MTNERCAGIFSVVFLFFFFFIFVFLPPVASNRNRNESHVLSSTERSDKGTIRKNNTIAIPLIAKQNQNRFLTNTKEVSYVSTLILERMS